MILIVRAFAFGSVALSGTEAITNGVPAFKPPEARNAANTMTAMGLLLGTIFVGVSVLAFAFGIVPDPTEEVTLIAQVAQQVFGDGLAFVALPGGDDAHPHPGRQHRLQWRATPGPDPGGRRVHAPPVRDPRRPSRVQLGDRHPGRLCVLADLALRRVGPRPDPALLDRDLPLVRHLPGRHGPPLVRRVRGGGWRWKLGLNFVGAVVTGLVFVISAASKIPNGAWIVLITVPVLVGLDALGARPVPRPGGRAAGGRRRRDPPATPDPARGRDGQRHQPGGGPGGQRGANAERRHPGGLRDGRSRRRRRPAGAVDPPAARRAVRRRGVPVSCPDRTRRGLPRRPRPDVVARQGGADDDRDPPRVRRPPLVGPLPLQPGGPPAPGAARRPGAHGRPRRAVPERGRPGGRSGIRRGPERRPRRSTRIAPPCDRWTTAAPGTQGRRPPGAGGAAPLGVLPVHRARHDDREGVSVAGTCGISRTRADDPPLPLWAAALQRGGGVRAPPQEARPPDLQLRRDQLLRLRHGGDPARLRGGRRGRAPPLDRDGVRDRRAPRRGVALVPPGLPRLPVGRGRLRGGPREHRPPGRAGGRGSAAHRLRHDGRGFHGGGRLAGLFSGSRALRHPGRDRARRDRRHHHRQPARAARGGAPLRQPDLPVRGDDPAHDWPRRCPDRLWPGTGQRPAGR